MCITAKSKTDHESFSSSDIHTTVWLEALRKPHQFSLKRILFYKLPYLKVRNAEICHYQAATNCHTTFHMSIYLTCSGAGWSGDLILSWHYCSAILSLFRIILKGI